jgi:hypothetical protein
MGQDLFILRYFDQNANNFEGAIVEETYDNMKEARRKLIFRIEYGYEAITLCRVDEKRNIIEVIHS